MPNFKLSSHLNVTFKTRSGYCHYLKLQTSTHTLFVYLCAFEYNRVSLILHTVFILPSDC